MVLPLAHEGIVLGVLVSSRDAPPWSQEEQRQAEQVANTLALACIMDRRGQWLQQQLQQRQLNQTDQSETFHDLLHQFRNPLTALQTFGKLLVKRMPTDDPNQPIAEGIVRESRRLEDLAQYFDNAVAEGDEALQTASLTPSIAGLLSPGTTPQPSLPIDSTSVSSATPEDGQGHGLGHALRVVPGQLAAVVNPLLRSTAALAQDRELYLEQDIPADLPEVWLDPEALGEVISNLLDNALKYSPAKTLIWVTGGLVQQIDGQFFQGIAVGDSGMGIPPEDQPHIFERHYRGIQTEGEIAGTGLGLAIVQELVQGMGGHIDLISPVQVEQWVNTPLTGLARGPGTLFMVWLRTV
ncbi:MAG: GAF domain-containing sensor histidine kinase [Leptolyngbyaceae cyanobacterium SM2_3_12]|nr:GAF domain-containing sensor histidine kinase [Leptolyngbyaceae cyanobacterium SM2_3_12]